MKPLYKKIINGILSLVFVSSLVYPLLVYTKSVEASDPTSFFCDPAKPVAGCKTNTDADDARTKVSGKADAGEEINAVIKYITFILAGLFVLMMLVGAVWYMAFSATDKKQKGMEIIQAAIIAGVFALLSFAVWRILNSLLL